MADNVAFTPGSGATVAADDVGGILYQRVKLSLGADASAVDAKVTDVDSGGGTDVALAVALTVPASGGGVIIGGDANGRLNVNHESRALVSVTPTIDTAAYTAADQMGGVMTFAGAAIANAGMGRIIGAVISNQAITSPVLELWVFQNTPTMVGSNNAAFDVTDANLETAKLICVIEFPVWYATASNQVAVGSVRGMALGSAHQAYLTGASSTSIFGVLLTRNAVTQASAADVVVTLTLARG